MDLLGDIVEHETHVDAVTSPVAPGAGKSSVGTGFPVASAKKPSRWRQRLQNKGIASMSGSVDQQNTVLDDGKFYTTDKDTNLKKFKDPSQRTMDYTGLNDQEQIHQENIEILSRMSVQEREEAKQDLLDNLDPKVLQLLMKRSSRKYGKPGEDIADEKKKHENPPQQGETEIDPIYQPVEGSMGTWVGGEHELDRETMPVSTPEDNSGSKSRAKSVRFEKEAKVIYLNQKEKVQHESSAASEAEWEDVEDISNGVETADKSSESMPQVSPNINDDAEPTLQDSINIQKQSHEEILNSSSGVHFPKPTQPYEELDINDPKFNDKLYAKYFPDLPKNPKQLEWMQPVNETEIPKEVIYDSIESVRFDFKGDIISSENIDQYLHENQGLYNHSKNPELPGYTLPELAHYLRSTFPGQVCIACRTLGRILFKLGSLQYQVSEIKDDQDINNDLGNEGEFETECWRLIIQLKIIELLENYSNEKQRNISIQNYAIDALWLWKKGNGDKKIEKYLKLAEQESS